MGRLRRVIPMIVSALILRLGLWMLVLLRRGGITILGMHGGWCFGQTLWIGLLGGS